MMKMLALTAVGLLLPTTPKAADAIVASEPEPVEYVRVCDAYGTGYFYIPGSETCLRMEGYIRFEARFGEEAAGNDEDWSFWTRAQARFTAKSETEWGPLTSVLTLRSNAEDAEHADVFLNEGYIDLAGVRVGMQYSWWDDDPSGETDFVASNTTRHNAIRYQYEAHNWAAGLGVEELEDTGNPQNDFHGGNDLGIIGQVSAKVGAFTGYVLGGYDADAREGAIRAIGYVDVGPGQLGVYGVWASGANYYYEESEWTVGAQYEAKITDKWSVTPGVQYFSSIDIDPEGDFTGGDAWIAGVTVDYKVVPNLAAKLSVQYQDQDDGDHGFFGFLRGQRDF